MFAIKLTEIKSSYFDLNELPPGKWPREAKEMAKNILNQPSWRKKFYEQLPALRKSWLVQKIYDSQNLIEEL